MDSSPDYHQDSLSCFSILVYSPDLLSWLIFRSNSSVSFSWFIILIYYSHVLSCFCFSWFMLLMCLVLILLPNSRTLNLKRCLRNSSHFLSSIFHPTNEIYGQRVHPAASRCHGSPFGGGGWWWWWPDAWAFWMYSEGPVPLSPSSNGSLGETCFLNVDSLKKSVLSRHGPVTCWLECVVLMFTWSTYFLSSIFHPTRFIHQRWRCQRRRRMLIWVWWFFLKLSSNRSCYQLCLKLGFSVLVIGCCEERILTTFLQ